MGNKEMYMNVLTSEGNTILTCLKRIIGPIKFDSFTESVFNIHI